MRRCNEIVLVFIREILERLSPRLSVNQRVGRQHAYQTESGANETDAISHEFDTEQAIKRD